VGKRDRSIGYGNEDICTAKADTCSWELLPSFSFLQKRAPTCHPERSEGPAFSRQRHEPESSINLKSEITNLKSAVTFHRRDALWQIEKAVRRSGPLLEEFPEPDASSPLQQMTYEERLVADFHGTGLTVGPHPMAYRRAEMQALGVHPASSLKSIPSGRQLRIGGCVIARQRPGTAKGFVFLSLEDETGIANAIVHPDLLQKNRILLISGRFLMVEGILWVMRTGGSWRALPGPFGPWQTVAGCYHRWRHAGVWERIRQVLLAPDVPCPSSA